MYQIDQSGGNNMRQMADCSSDIIVLFAGQDKGNGAKSLYQFPVCLYFFAWNFFGGGENIVGFL